MKLNRTAQYRTAQYRTAKRHLSSALCACLLTATPQLQAATISDLLISEVMANPLAVLDSVGEWFELFNPTGIAIDLDGIELSDLGGNAHTINNGGQLLINPGSTLLFARNGDPTQNGGIHADYVYSSFALGNSDDEIILTDSLGNQLQLFYTAGFVGNGVSSEYTGGGLLQNNFELASLSYGAGDLGTPGSYSAAVSHVPIPGAFWLMASGAGLLGLSRRKGRGA